MVFEEPGGPARYPTPFNPTSGHGGILRRRADNVPIDLVDISAIRVVPLSGGDMPDGFYMGRKHVWRLDASFITVMVIQSEFEPRVLEVHEPGRSRISHPREWMFIGRVIGLREVSTSYRRAAEAWARGETTFGA